MGSRQDVAPAPPGVDPDGECLAFVVSHLFCEGGECPGASRCLRTACGKVMALHTFVARKFAAEEAAMGTMDRAGLVAHREDHRRFLRRLRAIAPSCNCDDTLRRLRCLIDEWMCEHLETFDGALGLWARRGGAPAEGVAATVAPGE